MTKLLIARHGNTFNQGDTVVRVGLKTDLPLSDSGRKQALALGQFFNEHRMDISAAYSSKLCRTYETAKIALATAKSHTAVIQEPIFNEVDYGVDEGKTEEEVIARIGKKALQEWDHEAKVPVGWQITPSTIIQNWQRFAAEITEKHHGQTVLVVTSNGIARFSPHLCHNFNNFKESHNIKLATGALACFSHNQDTRQNTWEIDYWNIKPRLEPTAMNS